MLNGTVSLLWMFIGEHKAVITVYLQALATSGASFNCRDQRGNTPAHLATAHGNSYTLASILRGGTVSLLFYFVKQYQHQVSFILDFMFSHNTN